MKHRVRFQPQGLLVHVPEGITAFNAANWVGLAIDSTCGGRGTCGKCRVRVRAGDVPATAADHHFLSEAEREAGWRLACRALVSGECEFDVPRLMTEPKAALLGYGRHVAINPNVKKIFLELPEPSLEDQRSDLQRLTDSLSIDGHAVEASLTVWRSLPRTLRASGFAVTAVICGSDLIAIEAGDTTDRNFGIAFDIGTTTVVGALVDLRTGAALQAQSALNTQAVHGADVIARITYAMLEPDGLEVLQTNIRETLTGLIERLLASAALPRDEVYEVVVAGNATMLHLLMGISPEPIGVEPFVPAVTKSTTVRASELGLLLHPETRLTTLPHLGAYVGADIVAGILATGLARQTDPGYRLFIDVGTNGEIVLGSRDRTIATAAPAGPAFEGAQITCGMRASQGAIEGVKIDDDVRLQIIGGVERPLGLCGSGLVDAVAELLNRGLLDASGLLIRREEAEGHLPRRLVERLHLLPSGMRAFRLSNAEDGIVLTQGDIRALQFAKAAIAAGSSVLLAAAGVRAEDLVEVQLAGSFGTYINPASARTIGLVPAVSVEHIVAVGNAAGEGAKMALLSYREREAAARLPDFVEYLELSGRPEFNDIFAEALAFPRSST